MPATRTSAFVLFVAFTVAMTPEAVSQSRTGGTSSSRKCSTLREPRRLPPVDQVVDSTALVAQLSTLPASHHGAEVVLSLAHTGDSTSVHVVATPSAGVGDTVRRLVQNQLRLTRSFEAPHLRVQLVLAEVVTLGTARSQLCLPILAERQLPQQPFVEVPLPASGRVRDTIVKILIDASGVVTEAVVQSSSGVPELDDFVLRSMRSKRYEPALLDGRAVSVWLDRGRAVLVE